LPNLRSGINHDLLLLREDTRSVFQTLAAPELTRVNQHTYAGGYLEELIRGESVHSTWDQVPNSEVDFLVLDSFSHDRFIYDPMLRNSSHITYGRYDPEFLDQLTAKHFGVGHVLVISPFKVSKETVPFSPESVYSPYPPDLPFRVSPGPYIEVYGQDQAVIDKLGVECAQRGLPCKLLPVQEGYYFQYLPYRG
jgi:hypothetical protein